MTLQIHNTLTDKIDTFKPIQDNKVTLYTCGPTVYNYPHVGNWAAYVYWDILMRVLLAEGYQVERVMNITDVGHLVSDADEGEDKLEKGARREGKTAWEIAEFYAEDFVAGMEKLGLIPPEHLVKATDFIPQQLDLIRILKEKGYTYQTRDGIYFDTSKFPTYADFAHLDLDAQKAGARVEVNPEKRNPSDFALWKFTPAGRTRDMQWETPDDLLDLPRHESANERVTRGGAEADQNAHGATLATRASASQGDNEHRTVPYAQYGEGEAELSTQNSAASISSAGSSAARQANAASMPVMGFPGWHLECSAIAMSILGPTIDIHTGGIDHIPVHHTNEIAQSEAASGVRFANYWLHNNHIKSNGTKISKSLNNGYTLQDLEAEGFSPLDYRMFILQGQFTNEGNFTFENLEAAKNRLQNWRNYATLRHQTHDRLNDDSTKHGDKHVSLLAASGALREALANNLNTPLALSIADEAFSKLDGKSTEDIHQHGLVEFIRTIDSLLGMQLEKSTPDITDEQKQLIIERQRAREAKDWAKSDKLRDQLANAGISVNDTSSGAVWNYL